MRPCRSSNAWSRPFLLLLWCSTYHMRLYCSKIFPIHRLDHRTSGVMLLSFNSEMAATLHDQAIRKGTKKYIALVRGIWSHEQEIIVDRPVKINEITEGARTKFSCLATLEGNNERSSLVLCEPLSGRTHQIRRHAYSIGHPIIGDTEHGDSKVNRWWREERNLNRLALHCWSIEFSLNGNHHTCMAPLPEPFRGVLQATCLWGSALEKIPNLSVEPYDDHGGSFGRNFKKEGQS